MWSARTPTCRPAGLLPPPPWQLHGSVAEGWEAKPPASPPVVIQGATLMLGTGTGSEIRQPLGYAMVGGLIVSQALTLFTTPVIYLYLDRLSNAFSNWGRSGGARGDQAESESASVKEAAE